MKGPSFLSHWFVVLVLLVSSCTKSRDQQKIEVGLNSKNSTPVKARVEVGATATVENGMPYEYPKSIAPGNLSAYVEVSELVDESYTFCFDDIEQIPEEHRGESCETLCAAFKNQIPELACDRGPLYEEQQCLKWSVWWEVLRPEDIDISGIMLPWIRYDDMVSVLISASKKTSLFSPMVVKAKLSGVDGECSRFYSIYSQHVTNIQAQVVGASEKFGDTRVSKVTRTLDLALAEQQPDDGGILYEAPLHYWDREGKGFVPGFMDLDMPKYPSEDRSNALLTYVKIPEFQINLNVILNEEMGGEEELLSQLESEFNSIEIFLGSSVASNTGMPLMTGWEPLNTCIPLDINNTFENPNFAEEKVQEMVGEKLYGIQIYPLRSYIADQVEEAEFESAWGNPGDAPFAGIFAFVSGLTVNKLYRHLLDGNQIRPFLDLSYNDDVGPEFTRGYNPFLFSEKEPLPGASFSERLAAMYGEKSHHSATAGVGFQGSCVDRERQRVTGIKPGNLDATAILQGRGHGFYQSYALSEKNFTAVTDPLHLPHELGHVIGKLHDEYVDASPEVDEVYFPFENMPNKGANAYSNLVNLDITNDQVYANRNCALYSESLGASQLWLAGPTPLGGDYYGCNHYRINGDFTNYTLNLPAFHVFGGLIEYRPKYYQGKWKQIRPSEDSIMGESNWGDFNHVSCGWMLFELKKKRIKIAEHIKLPELFANYQNFFDETPATRRTRQLRPLIEKCIVEGWSI